jgi:hypothetical protein
MKQNFWTLSLVLGSLLFLSSCGEESDLPNEPVVNDLEFKTATNELVLRFTDGDGNFGLADRDTLPPYQQFLDSLRTEENPYYYNYWLNVLIKEDGNFIPLDAPSTFNARVPVLTPAGQNKQLRVTVTNDLDFDLSAFAQLGQIENGDTLKFQVVLVDRDLNESVMKETEGVFSSD